MAWAQLDNVGAELEIEENIADFERQALATQIHPHSPRSCVLNCEDLSRVFFLHGRL